jgi:hypothetical protein
VKTLSLLLVFLLIPALACSTTGIAESLVPSGGVLYQDIFSNPASGWGELNEAAGSAGYINGAYHFAIKQPNVNLWSHPGMAFSNVHEEVSVMAVAGPLTNRMGLICRLKDDKNYYFFAISADGFYGIGKMQDGQSSLLTGDSMQSNNAILTGNQINRVGADCIGNTLVLYVNGVLVTSTTDTAFSSGDVGILTGSFDQPGADIYFDNFVVYKP